MKTVVSIVVSVLLLTHSLMTLAHSRSQSFSTWTIESGSVRLLFTVKSREVTRLPPLEGNITELDQLLKTHLQNSISVLSRGKPCPLDKAYLTLTAQEGYSRVEAQFNCSLGGEQGDRLEELTIINNGFFAVAPSHIHYARIGLAGQMPKEYLFSDAQRQQQLTITAEGLESNTGFGSYFYLGVEHILAGIDHLVFLLSLLLVSRRLKDVVFMITGFTLGHSVTLSLAALNIVTPNIPVIESLIGFTIALVALECVIGCGLPLKRVLMGSAAALGTMILGATLYPMTYGVVALVGVMMFTLCYLTLSVDAEWKNRLHPIMTVLFGLVHGFGFANVLMEIGLPQERMLWALLGFNLGVELGQLLFVVGVGLVAVLALRAWPKLRVQLTVWLSSGICGVGVYWFLGRALAV
jgi:HupE / UreJ protein